MDFFKDDEEYAFRHTTAYRSPIGKGCKFVEFIRKNVTFKKNILAFKIFSTACKVVSKNVNDMNHAINAFDAMEKKLRRLNEEHKKNS